MTSKPTKTPPVTEDGDGLEESGPLFDPVGRALDLIGERWTLVLVSHLLGGARGFQELRERTGIGPRSLSTRLRQLAERDLVESVPQGNRSLYALTPRGHSLEPLIREMALWWVQNFMKGSGPFRETTAATVVESLPFLLREERARDARITYELRLKGKGGGVWTVTINDGACRVNEGFAERANVRYTADARDWTLLAIGLIDDREAFRDGRLTKDGQGGSIAWYFHQPYTPSRKPTGD